MLIMTNRVIAIFVCLVSTACIKCQQDDSIPNPAGRRDEEKSVFDRIADRNAISLQAEKDVEGHKNNKNNYLLQKEASVLQTLTEGDMLLDAKDMSMIKSDKSRLEATKRSVMLYARKLWISRIVPYEIAHYGTVRFNQGEVEAKIKDALRNIESKSCIRFQPKKGSDQNWLHFFKGSGCYSGIGRRYWEHAPTKISLGDYCVYPSIIEHEIFHALGFFHEQSRSDRDSFINVHWNNIIEDQKHNFDRHLSYDSTIQNTKYDYASLMHYGKTAFSKNGENTIEAKFDRNQPLGGDYLTHWDELELNKMYQCSSKDDASLKANPWSSWGDWTPDCFDHHSKGCVAIRQRFCTVDTFKMCEGADEFGVEDQYKQCSPTNCTIEITQPHWGNWAPYTQCSLTCGEGTQVRERICDNPPPIHGMKCKGYRTQTSLCKVRKCEIGKYDTDFGNGLLPWRQDYQVRMRWKTTSGSTPSPSSGPENDHTTGTGSYAYISAVDPYMDTHKLGRLISPKIPANDGAKCMTFYYQMNGKHIEYLDVYIRLLTDDDYKTYLMRDGHQGNWWQRGAVSIPNRSQPYEIHFEGKLGIAPDSDIAIDDIQVDNGLCPQGSQGCQNYYSHCDYWRNHGECYKNSRWMLRHCCTSCSGMAECSNKYDGDLCEIWASVNECKHNPRWMWPNCCKACKGCLNKHQYCGFWASIGECKKNIWMKSNCKNSCGICRA